MQDVGQRAAIGRSLERGLETGFYGLILMVKICDDVGTLQVTETVTPFGQAEEMVIFLRRFCGYMG